MKNILYANTGVRKIPQKLYCLGQTVYSMQILHAVSCVIVLYRRFRTQQKYAVWVSSGQEWLIPDGDYRYSFIGEVNLPKNYEVSFEVELVKSNSFTYPITIGSYTGGINKNNLPTLPFVNLKYEYIYIQLSGTVAADYCYYRFWFKNNLPINTIYKVSFNFLTDEIEVFFNDQLLSTCQEIQVENYKNIFSCEVPSGEGIYDNIDHLEYFCNKLPESGFYYEAKAYNEMPVYAGNDYDYGVSKPREGGRVRNINIYTLN